MLMRPVLGVLSNRREFLAGALAGRWISVVCVFDNPGKLADRQVVARV